MKKIALIENFAEDFINSRVRYAEFLINKGYDVYAIIPESSSNNSLEKSGIKVIEIKNDPRNLSLFSILTYCYTLIKIFNKENFDIIHFYRLQPNLIGSSMARLISRDVIIINHITGLGLAFTSQHMKNRILQTFIKIFYRYNSYILKARLITQNIDDPRDLKLENRCNVVRGSAVNESIFKPNFNSIKLNKNEINLLFVSRLIRQKGILELTQAVEEINKSNKTKINLSIVGWIDEKNPNSLTEKEVQKLNQSDNISFFGRQKNICDFIKTSDICVLPSYYREGVPRFLLESMAMGKPIITTNLPGCKELIKDGLNGYLTAPYSSLELKKVINKTCNLDLIKAGKESYKIYKEFYSELIVYTQLEKIYEYPNNRSKRIFR